MLAPAEMECQRKRNRREMAGAVSRRSSLPAFIEIELGFATPRRLGKHSQRICRLGAALLLKLRDPVSHSLNHVARRFTCGCCFCLNDWTGFLALLDNLDCFLLRHCFYFEFVESVNVSNEILATQFPKLVNLERRTAITLAKKRPHPLTRTTKEKRATSREIIFADDVFGVITLANRTPKIRATRTDAPILIRVARFSAPCPAAR